MKNYFYFLKPNNQWVFNFKYLTSSNILNFAMLLLGLIVMGGWHLDKPSVIQIRPHWAPMQYNAALCFVLCALAYLSHNKVISNCLFWFVTVLCSATLVQYIFSVDLMIDQLFIVSNYTTNTSSVGRMAPPTAICFIVHSIGKLTEKLGSISLSAHFVSLVSFICFVGYAIGFDTYTWFNLTSMAMHTSIGFLLLSASNIIDNVNYRLNLSDTITKLNAALSLEKQRIDLSLHFAKIGTWNLDLSTNKFFCDDVLTDLFECHIEDYTSFTKLITKGKGSEINNYIMSLIAGDLNYYKKDFEIMTLNGNVKNVTMTGSVVDRKLIGLIIDMSNYINLLNDLEQSNKELAEFAYITSHDLKSPLRAISNLSTWIVEDLKDNKFDDVYQNLEILQSRVTRMDNLINGILEYSRVGRINSNVALLDTNSVLKDVVNNFNCHDFNIKINDMPNVYFDKTRLIQIFDNLISNAIKHHDTVNGNIEISCVDKGRFHQFCVSDDGPGIQPAYHERIFRIFQTLVSKDKKESTGIGLTLVKKIIEENDGSIWVKSNPEVKRGCEFYFTIIKRKNADV